MEGSGSEPDPCGEKPVGVPYAPLRILAVIVLCHVPASAGPLRFEVEYATYFGGPQYEEAREAIVYPDGSVLVGLLAKSKGLPTSKTAYQRAYAGDDPNLGHGGVFGECARTRSNEFRSVHRPLVAAAA